LHPEYVAKKTSDEDSNLDIWDNFKDKWTFQKLSEVTNGSI
jgi:hypothetical protein